MHHGYCGSSWNQLFNQTTSNREANIIYCLALWYRFIEWVWILLRNTLRCGIHSVSKTGCGTLQYKSSAFLKCVSRSLKTPAEFVFMCIMHCWYSAWRNFFHLWANEPTSLCGWTKLMVIKIMSSSVDFVGSQQWNHLVQWPGLILPWIGMTYITQRVQWPHFRLKIH